MACLRGHLFFIDSYRQNLSNVFSENTGPIEANNIEPQMTKLAAMPSYGEKNFKNHLLWNQRVNGPGAWYTALEAYTQ